MLRILSFSISYCFIHFPSRTTNHTQFVSFSFILNYTTIQLPNSLGKRKTTVRATETPTETLTDLQSWVRFTNRFVTEELIVRENNNLSIIFPFIRTVGWTLLIFLLNRVSTFRHSWCSMFLSLTNLDPWNSVKKSNQRSRSYLDLTVQITSRFHISRYRDSWCQ